MPGGLNIGDLLLMLLADGSRLREDITRQGLAAADAAGPVIGKSLGAKIADGLSSSGKTMAKIGRNMMQNLTLPIVAAGTAITVVGLKFDTTLRQIVALTDITAQEIGGVRDEILKLAPAVGKSPQELAEAFYFLASGGFDAKESLDILTQSAKAAASGLGLTSDVTKVIGASINAFGKDNLTATDAVDQLIRAIKDGTAEAPDFAGALGDVVGSAGLLGVTFADTTGALAKMTIEGISADEAATSLNQVFRSLFKVTPQAAKGFAEVGLTAEGLRQQLKDKGLLSVLQTLEVAFKDNDVAAGKAFGNVRALRGVLALIGADNGADTARILTDVAGGATTLASAFDDTEGPGRAVDRALAKIQVTLIELSEDTLPIAVELIEDLADIIQTAAKWFKSLPDPVRDFTVRALALTAALGPLLFVTGKVVQSFGAMFHALDYLAKTRVGAKIGAALVDPIVNSVEGLQAKLNAPTSRVGRFLGATLGKAFAAGLVFAAVAAVIEVANRVQAELDAIHFDIDVGVKGVVDSGSVDALLVAKAGLEQGIKDIQNNENLQMFGGIDELLGFSKSEIAKLQAQLDLVNMELTRRAAGFGPALANGMASGEGALIKATDSLVDKIGNAVSPPKISAAARAAGQSIPQSLAKGIVDKQHEPVDALDALKWLMKHALTSTARIGRDIGILLSGALAKGLKDKRPEVVAEAKRTRAVAEKDLAELIIAGGQVGEKAGDKLKAGLRSKNPVIRAAAKRVKAIVQSELDKTVPAAGAAGAAAGEQFAYKLTAAMKTALANAAAAINAALARTFDFPLNNPPKQPDGKHKAIGGPVSAGMPYKVNENTPRSEIFVPSVGGHILTHGAAVGALKAAATQGSGDTYINVPVLGALPVRSARDIVTELRRAGELGILPPPTLPPTYPRREATPR